MRGVARYSSAAVSSVTPTGIRTSQGLSQLSSAQLPGGSSFFVADAPCLCMRTPLRTCCANRNLDLKIPGPLFPTPHHHLLLLPRTTPVTPSRPRYSRLMAARQPAQHTPATRP
jgi:hypothetical protein